MPESPFPHQCLVVEVGKMIMCYRNPKLPNTFLESKGNTLSACMKTTNCHDFHRKLHTLLLHHQSPTWLLCVPQACYGFLRMWETQSLWLMILKSYCCVWNIPQVFHTDVSKCCITFVECKYKIFPQTTAKKQTNPYTERYKSSVNI